MPGLRCTITNERPSGETSQLLCGLAVTMSVTGKRGRRAVTVNDGAVRTLAAINSGGPSAVPR